MPYRQASQKSFHHCFIFIFIFFAATHIQALYFADHSGISIIVMIHRAEGWSRRKRIKVGYTTARDYQVAVRIYYTHAQAYGTRVLLYVYFVLVESCGGSVRVIVYRVIGISCYENNGHYNNIRKVPTIFVYTIIQLQNTIFTVPKRSTRGMWKHFTRVEFPSLSAKISKFKKQNIRDLGHHHHHIIIILK